MIPFTGALLLPYMEIAVRFTPRNFETSHSSIRFPTLMLVELKSEPIAIPNDSRLGDVKLITFTLLMLLWVPAITTPRVRMLLGTRLASHVRSEISTPLVG